MIIEARINEYRIRGYNGNDLIPYTMDEIVRDAVKVQEAGAAQLHWHSRHPDGNPDHAFETQYELIRRLRENTDLILLPTLGSSTNDDDPDYRINNMRRLCGQPMGRPDMVPIDPGSLNWDEYDRENKVVRKAGNTYINTTETLMRAATAFSDLDLNIQLFCWAPNHVRRAAMLMELGYIKMKPHFNMHLSSGVEIYCNPLTKLGLDSMLEPMPEGCPWFVTCSGGNIFELLPYITQKGGNVSLGLGDYDFHEFGEISNGDLIAKAKAVIEENGREVATPSEARKILGIGE